ncbi:MAG: hypothetical protein H6716_20820 [Polyangiaceae bacterium]|nr:hypothetical protein [Polyangiaceae bacterium]
MSETTKKKLIHRYTEETWVEDGDTVEPTLGQLRPEDADPDDDDRWDEDDEGHEADDPEPGCDCDER